VGVLRKSLTFLLLLFLLFISAIFAISLGPVKIPFFEVLQALFTPRGEYTTIVVNIRLARVLLAISTGIALSTAGASVQCIFQNPLAEPYVLGISAGSVLGALIGIIFFPSYSHSTQFFSFLFALLTIFVVYRIGGLGGSPQPSSLLLAGIAITALFSAISSYLIYINLSKNIANILFWTMGGFWQSDLKNALAVFSVSLFSTLCLLLFWRELNAMALGENFALSVGVDVAKTRAIVILLLSLSVSFAVSFTGIIGFVGLIVPHMARMLCGEDHKHLLPFSAVIGALLLLWADTFSRNLIYGEEIPVGIITATLGVPFFLYLLTRRRRAC